MLDESCLPYGVLRDADPAYFPAGEKQQRYEFDFFNYAGIHRPVRLYTTPDAYIKDITVVTDICGTDGIVNYRVVLEGTTDGCEISLLDEDGVTVAQAQGTEGKLCVPNAKLWEVIHHLNQTLFIASVKMRMVRWILRIDSKLHLKIDLTKI